MATVPYERLVVPYEGDVSIIRWFPMTATDNVGQRLFTGHRPGKSVHARGTFGGAITLRGSNIPNADVTVAADWFTLADARTLAAWSSTSTSTALAEILESCLWVSPAAASGVTSIAVYLCLALALAPDPAGLRP